MNKSHIVERMQERFPRRSGHEIEKATETILATIADALANGGRVELRGFGSFRVNRRDAREGRNPATGAVVAIGEKRSLYFRAGKEMRGAMAESG